MEETYLLQILDGRVNGREPSIREPGIGRIRKTSVFDQILKVTV